jgi:flagellar biosynthesis/type III secretory pathway M-ring protein FliF/YscJ
MDWRILAGVAAGGLLIVAAVFFAARRFKKKTKGASAVEVAGPPALPAGAETAPLRDGEDAAEALPPSAAKLLGQAQDQVVQTARIEQLSEQIRKSVGADPALAASVLRTWVEEIER